jgi:hypothetical protein
VARAKIQWEREIMLKALALTLVLITAMEAQAAPAALLCTGTSDDWSSTRGPQWSESHDVILPMTIDIARNMMVLENREYPIMAVSDDTVFVDAYLYGIDIKITQPGDGQSVCALRDTLRQGTSRYDQYRSKI